MDDGGSIQATDPILFPFVILVKTWCYFGFTNSSLSDPVFPSPYNPWMNQFPTMHRFQRFPHMISHHESSPFLQEKCPNWYCYESISASYHSFDSLSHHHPILQTLPVDSEYNSQTSLLLPTCPPLNSTVFSSLPLSVQWSFLIMTADRSVTLFFILQSFWWFDR